MKRIFSAALFVAALLPTARTGAQAPVQTIWSITGVSQHSVDFNVKVRNTQGYDPVQAFGITHMIAAYNGPGAQELCPPFCIWTTPNLFLAGNVDTSPMNVGSEVSYFSFGGLTANYINNSYAYFGQKFGQTGHNTWGIMGCTPVSVTWVGGSSFGGRTCAQEGFDGWIETDISFRTYGILDLKDLTAENFSIGWGGEYVALAVVAPEPGTYALMVVGLLFVGAAVRKRDRINTVA